MDIPFYSLKYILTQANTQRYEPYGIFILKDKIYESGVRPVLYLSDEEIKELNIPSSQFWRVVKFEKHPHNWICWLHEREWRCPNEFHLINNLGVLVKTPKDAITLNKLIQTDKNFNIKPSVILPLSVVCQGLEY